MQKARSLITPGVAKPLMKVSAKDITRDRQPLGCFETPHESCGDSPRHFQYPKWLYASPELWLRFI